MLLSQYFLCSCRCHLRRGQIWSPTTCRCMLSVNFSLCPTKLCPSYQIPCCKQALKLPELRKRDNEAEGGLQNPCRWTSPRYFILDIWFLVALASFESMPSNSIPTLSPNTLALILGGRWFKTIKLWSNLFKYVTNKKHNISNCATYNRGDKY